MCICLECKKGLHQIQCVSTGDCVNRDFLALKFCLLFRSSAAAIKRKNKEKPKKVKELQRKEI